MFSVAWKVAMQACQNQISGYKGLAWLIIFSFCSAMEVVLLILFLCAYIATMISVELLLITYIIASSVSEPIFQRYNAPLTHELAMTRWSFKARTML